MEATKYGAIIGVIISPILIIGFAGDDSGNNTGTLLIVGIINGLFWGWLIGLIIQNAGKTQPEKNKEGSKKNAKDISERSSQEGKNKILLDKLVRDGLKDKFLKQFKIIIDERVTDFIDRKPKLSNDPMMYSMGVLNILNSTTNEIIKAGETSSGALNLKEEDWKDISSKVYDYGFNKYLEADPEKENSEDEEIDILPDKSTRYLPVYDHDKFLVSSIFFKFCNSSQLASKILDVDDPVNTFFKLLPNKKITLELFKKTMEGFQIDEVSSNGSNKFKINNFSFTLDHRRIPLEGRGNYLDILSNNIRDLVNQENEPFSCVTDFVVFLKLNYPESIYTITQNPILNNYSIRQIFEDGNSTHLGSFTQNDPEIYAPLIRKSLQLDEEWR